MFGLGLDWQPNDSLFIGGEFTRRNLRQPVVLGDQAIFEKRDEWLHRIYAYWTPDNRWSLSAEAIYDKYENEDSIEFNRPSELRTISLPLQARYFHPSGWFAGVGATYVDQKVRRPEFSALAAGDSSFTVVDLAAGYRLPQRRGILSLSVQNVFDRDFDYQDDSLRSFADESSTGPYIPERIIMGKITLNF